MFHAKLKVPQFRTKITLFGYFGLELEKAIVIFAINKNPQIFLKSKVLCKNENP